MCGRLDHREAVIDQRLDDFYLVVHAKRARRVDGLVPRATRPEEAAVGIQPERIRPQRAGALKQHHHGPWTATVTRGPEHVARQQVIIVRIGDRDDRSGVTRHVRKEWKE